MERMKEKRRSGGKDIAASLAADSSEAEAPRRHVIAEVVEPQPLYVEEAVLQFEHHPEETVFVFINADESRINILYRRKNGELGLIDPAVS